MGSQIVFLSTTLLATCGILFWIARPLCLVAETFEVEVLRALNDPVLLKGSQQHFGQQLLAHLRTLDWGFRIGGAVFKTRPFMRVGAALLITSITAVMRA